MLVCYNELIDTTVLTSDGNSEVVTHFMSNLCYLICVRHLIRSRIVTNRIFLCKTYLKKISQNLLDRQYRTKYLACLKAIIYNKNKIALGLIPSTSKLELD